MLGEFYLNKKVAKDGKARRRSPSLAHKNPQDLLVSSLTSSLTSPRALLPARCHLRVFALFLSGTLSSRFPHGSFLSFRSLLKCHLNLRPRPPAEFPLPLSIRLQCLVPHEMVSFTRAGSFAAFFTAVSPAPGQAWHPFRGEYLQSGGGAQTSPSCSPPPAGLPCLHQLRQGHPLRVL